MSVQRHASILPWVLLSLFILGLGGGAIAWRYQQRVATEAMTTNDKIEVTFDSVVTKGLPVKFYAEDALQLVTVNEDMDNTYYLENLSDETIYIRPQHSVTPWDASLHFKLSKCFCFNDQSVAPHQKKEFIVTYRFTNDLDISTNKATMRYVIYRIEETDLRPIGTLPE
ncbi:MAG: cytochrome c oxidase assembly protein [Planctomycetes bacterium]|nr:cytochrome c oxidase assembly protein [Planctomycetota bacterium]